MAPALTWAWDHIPIPMWTHVHAHVHVYVLPCPTVAGLRAAGRAASPRAFLSSEPVDARLHEDVLADPSDRELRQVEVHRLSDEARATAADDRRDEEEQLVDQIRLEERGCERRSALEQQRLDAFGGERAQ